MSLAMCNSTFNQAIAKWRYFLLASFTILFTLAHFGCKTKQIVATEADVRKAINNAMPLVPDLSITSQSIPIIDQEEGDKPITYLVESKMVKEYVFRVTDYKLDWAGDKEKIDLDQLKSAIDRAYETQNPIPKEITGSITVGASYGPIVSGTVTINAPLWYILQLLGLIDGVTKLNVEKVEIAIKGFADGEKSDKWPRVVDHLPDNYRTFPVLGPSEENNDNWIFYHKAERERKIYDPYKNDDLPDLRAQYIRTEFVEPFVQRLDNKDRCRVYVLRNKAVSEKEKPEWRKAKVYVMIYLKRPLEPK
nr:hypothetical protein [uncultured bacterium]